MGCTYATKRKVASAEKSSQPCKKHKRKMGQFESISHIRLLGTKHFNMHDNMHLLNPAY